MTSVLITSIGSTTAIGAAKALRKSGRTYRIIGTDINPSYEIAGTIFCDATHRVPLFSESDYVRRMIAICRREEVDLIIPIVDQEVEALTAASNQFIEAGISIVASDHDVIMACNDKHLTWKRLLEGGITTPRVYLPSEASEIQNFPVFIKPRQGVSSRDCHVVSSRDELNFFLKRLDDLVIQEYMTGTQYVVDVLNGPDGRHIVAVPRKEISAKSGLGVKAVTVRDTALTEYAVQIATALGIRGPSNIEIFKDSSTIRFIEINPRLSAGSILSAAAGVNIADLSVRSFRGEQVTADNYRDGVYMTRYWDEVYFDNEQLMNY